MIFKDVYKRQYMKYICNNKGDEDKVSQALQKMMAEDVTLKTVNDSENRQTLLYGMGDQHLELSLIHICLSAGRSLCAEHGSEYPLFRGGTDSFVQYSFGKRNCICRSDLICRNSGSISGKTCTSYIETFGSDTRDICWWSGILYDL